MNRAPPWPSSERSRDRRARGEAGLYVIVDADACEQRGLDVGAVLLCMLQSAERPEVVQLRAKGRSDASIETWIETALPVAHEQQVELVVNDRPDLAALLGADSVHLGQDDSPLDVVRSAFPDLRVGLSTHDLAQLEAALAVPGLGYVALGPIFPTRSKERPEPVVGPELLAVAGERARAHGVPLVAIGGIDAARIVEVAPHVDLVAVIAAALPDQAGSAPDSGVTDAVARAISHQLAQLQLALRQSPRRA